MEMWVLSIWNRNKNTAVPFYRNVEIKIQKSKYMNFANMEYEMFLHTDKHWDHWNCN